MAASVVAASLIPKNQKIFAVSADSTLVEVIQLLAERRILSAPVVERLAADGGRPSDVLGFIDLFDIISYVLLAYTEDHDTVDGTHFRLWCQNLRTLQYRGRVFANHAVRDCINMSGLNPFKAVAPGAALSDVLSVFASGVHRVAVTDGTAMVGVVTHMDVMRYFAQHPELYQPIAYKTLADFGMVGSCDQISTIRDDSRALHGFHHMHQEKVSALAVVNNVGVLHNTLSVSDLKCLREENFPDLLLPVDEYLKKNFPHRPAVPRTEPTTTFAEATTFLSSSGVHRLWIVDEFRRPIGVLSLSDVMRIIREQLLAV
eukprot:TRINITY_DN1499_c0_g1_i2.p1 TRINITY_DN1499_c0_g1~~TRINITY_DN1499_c0_g1_i2.p1  ORF type:complete len:316 (-),score=110.93 TRINITY_DN1499_c0_g1_i2:50-997(-)